MQCCGEFKAKFKSIEWKSLALESQTSVNIAGKELSLSSGCIASLYIYHCSAVVDVSSEKYSGSTGHRSSQYQQRNLQ